MQLYCHEHEEIVSRYGEFVVQAARVPGVFSSALGHIGDIFRSTKLDYITPAVKYPTVIIPAEAGIQKGTGCRIKPVLDLIGGPA